MSIFGVRVAVIYVALGLVIAAIGGTVLEKLHMERYVEDFVKNAAALDYEDRTPTQRERLGYAKGQMIATFRKAFPYVLIGVGIGAAIHNWLPESWIERILGDGNPLGVVLATVVGVPMYADIFGTIPIAEALLSKGAQLGTVLAFMMAVTTLSLPSLILLRKAVKPTRAAGGIYCGLHRGHHCGGLSVQSASMDYSIRRTLKWHCLVRRKRWRIIPMRR